MVSILFFTLCKTKIVNIAEGPKLINSIHEAPIHIILAVNKYVLTAESVLRLRTMT